MESIVNFTENGNTLHCFFLKRLDTQTCNHVENTLHQRISEFLKGVDTANLVFDLTKVSYVSSAFLRICLCHFRQVGGKNFRIENAEMEVLQVFHISGFTEIMNITKI